jgi:transcriptional regulator with XRE-family HTH domain
MIPVQCKMARVAVGWGVRELAEAAQVSPDTVARFERGEELRGRTLEALQKALEAAGVVFTNGGEPGVKIRARGDGGTIAEDDLNSANDV